MIHTFELKKGTLIFEEDKIIINDNSQSQRNLWLFLSGIGIFIGAMFVLTFLISGNKILLWIGLFYMVAHILVMLGFLLEPVQNEIQLREVKSLILKERFGTNFLEIKLHNGKIKKVSQIENPKYLQDYFDIVLKHKWNIL